AKLSILDLMDGLEGNEIGLILFAGEAFVQFPLTTDVQSAKTFINAASSAAITRQGTAIEDALQLAIVALEPRESADRFIILLSDG
ncbi:MAG: hypothetical protein CUN54_11075, partial [Phototrophicales bacterium]